MSDHRDHPRYNGPDRRIRTPPGGVAKPALPPTRAATRSADRHAAIGKIPTFSSYRDWVNQVRSKWDPKDSE